MLVGYGTGPNKKGVQTPYWIIQNSWNTNWGEKGFARVERGTNLCGIAKSALYPVLKTIPPSQLKSIYPTENCEAAGDIYNAAGVYQKSFCFDIYTFNYQEARDWCARKRMRLYRSDDPTLNEVLYNFAKKKWAGSDGGDNFYVDGETAAGCSFVNLNADMYSQPFKVETADCAVERRAICEFVNIAREFDWGNILEFHL